MPPLCFITEKVHGAAGWHSLPYKKVIVSILATSQQYSVLFNQCVAQILHYRCGIPCKELRSTDRRLELLGVLGSLVCFSP